MVICLFVFSLIWTNSKSAISDNERNFQNEYFSHRVTPNFRVLSFFLFSSLAENYLDLQPSCFDISANNVRSLEVKNYAVTAREREAANMKRKTYKMQ